MHTCYPMKDTVKFLKEGGWDYTLLRDLVCKYLVDHVQANLNSACLSDHNDQLWWTETSKGIFTVKSAWELLRRKTYINEDLTKLWIPGIPFKISFLVWRIRFRRIHMASLMHKWNSNM